MSITFKKDGKFQLNVLIKKTEKLRHHWNSRKKNCQIFGALALRPESVMRYSANKKQQLKLERKSAL